MTRQATFVSVSAVVCKGHGFAAPYVMHANGPTWSGPDSIADLETTVEHCLELATKEKHTSICFPSIGSGR